MSTDFDVCKFMPPFQTCDRPEMLVIGLMFWLSGLVSVAALTHQIRQALLSRKRWFDQTALFWIFLGIWQFFRGAESIFYIPWTVRTFRLAHVGAGNLLLFIPMCILVLIIFDLLFGFRDPGPGAAMFFRTLFLSFLLVFMVLCVAICLVELDDTHDADLALSLWGASTEFVLAIFFLLPARALLQAATYPLVQPEDRRCVDFCRVGIWLFFAAFMGRMLWNLTHYYGFNWLQDELYRRPQESAFVRAINSLWFVFFDLLPSGLVTVAVILFKTHDLMFNDDPGYTRQTHW
jgi:hypothetical protein